MKITSPKFNWRYHKTGSISFCMIAKNEAKNLPRCVASIAPIADEIILVDTGSDDDTVKIAKSLGIKVYHQDWEDDFSKPRNYSLSKATKEWIFIVDPDEVISEKDLHTFKVYTSQFKYLAFQIVTRNYNRAKHEQGYTKTTGYYKEAAGYDGYILSNKTRLFKNGLGIIFTGCYHEMADWYILKNKIPSCSVLTPIHHWSHEISQTNQQEKRDFYLKLGMKKVAQNPEDDQAWWELGVTQAIAGLRNKAAFSMRMSLRHGYSNQKRLFTMAKVLRLINQNPLGRIAFEKGVCKLFSNLTHIDTYSKTYDSLIPISNIKKEPLL